MTSLTAAFEPLCLKAPPEVTARYLSAGHAPRFAGSVTSSEALQEALSLAGRDNYRVAVGGLGIRAHMGGVPEPYDALLLTPALDRLVDYQPADLTVTAQAGMSLAELNRHLAAHGQFLPLDVARPEETTLGGLVAAAPSGPSRARYGSVRDWLIGIGVISAEGRWVRAGGRVVKNVAGYDLCKLYTGSMGSLGAIAELSFRVYPLPERRITLSARFESLEAADRALDALNSACLEPSFVSCLLEADGCTLAVGAEGYDETVQWQHDRLWELLSSCAGTPRAAEESIRISLAEATLGEGASFVARVALKPSDVLSYWAEAQSLAGAVMSLSGVAYASNGLLWLNGDGSHTAQGWGRLVAALRERATTRGGVLVVERLPLDAKPGCDLLGAGDGPLRLMRALKHELDPQCLFPGGYLRDTA